MTSERKRSANRNNAAKSTGPKSLAGKRRSKNNALRHGFAAAGGGNLENVEEIKALTETLLQSIAGASIDAARDAASAEIDVIRIRKARTVAQSRLLNFLSLTDVEIATLNDTIRKLNDYERRAISRRKKAFNALLDGY
jgi:hypothetical protein